MEFKIYMIITVFTLITFVTTICKSSSLPEDFVTDNEEQLARLKRENFLESILKHLPFFRDTSEQQDENTETNREVKESTNLKDKSEDKIVPLMSSFVSSSSFASYEIQSIKMSSLINVTKSTFTASNTSINMQSSLISSLNKTITINLSSTPIISTSFTNSAFPKATTVLFTGSIIFNGSASKSNKTEAFSVVNFPVTSMMFSTAAFPSPSTPAPHLQSSAVDTAPLTSMPLQTVFSSRNNIASSAFSKTQATSVRHISSPLREEPVEQSIHVKQDEKQMPVLPDERGYGDKVYKLPGAENEKEVSFVYLHILLPVVSGISGALLITFSIMLFRCCRRRKLKKVRYFGGKPSSDFVRLDKMNLLTDTSDEEDFD